MEHSLNGSSPALAQNPSGRIGHRLRVLMPGAALGNAKTYLLSDRIDSYCRDTAPLAIPESI